MAGDNYGQGSSREHAALAPLYLGVKAVFAKSFARIHRSNLINSGILPLVFKNEEDYETISLYDTVSLSNLREGLERGEIKAVNLTKNLTYDLVNTLSKKERKIILKGGKINL